MSDSYSSIIGKSCLLIRSCRHGGTIIILAGAGRLLSRPRQRAANGSRSETGVEVRRLSQVSK